MTLGPLLDFPRAANQLTPPWTKTRLFLQENPDLGSPTAWSDTSGGTISPVTVTIPASGNKYYRLHGHIGTSQRSGYASGIIDVEFD